MNDELSSVFASHFSGQVLDRVRTFIRLNKLPEKPDPEITRLIAQSMVEPSAEKVITGIIVNGDLAIDDLDQKEKLAILECQQGNLPNFLQGQDGFINVDAFKKIIKYMHLNKEYREEILGLLSNYFAKQSRILIPNEHLGCQSYDNTKGHMENYPNNYQLQLSFKALLDGGNLRDTLLGIDPRNERELEKSLKFSDVKDILASVDDSPGPDQKSNSSKSELGIGPTIEMNGLGDFIKHRIEQDQGLGLGDIVSKIINMTINETCLSIDSAAQLIRSLDRIVSKHQSAFQGQYDEWYQAYRAHHGLD